MLIDFRLLNLLANSSGGHQSFTVRILGDFLSALPSNNQFIKTTESWAGPGNEANRHSVENQYALFIFDAASLEKCYVAVCMELGQRSILGRYRHLDGPKNYAYLESDARLIYL